MRLSTADSGAGDGVVVIDLEPAHWARQGSVSFDVTLNGTVIESADVVAGFMHRGAEKLFEARDYRQGMALANRHDWLAPAGGEILMARAAEELLGLPVPERARLHRALIVELTRVAALCAFIGPALTPLGCDDAPTRLQLTVRARENVLELIEELTGARMHVTYAVIGGVREAVTPEWCARVIAACSQIETTVVPAVAEAVESVADRWVAVGVISRERAVAYGASGVVGRASAIDLDVRRVDPDYATVTDLLPQTPDNGGGVTARMRGLVSELRAALRLTPELARQAGDGDGPVNTPLPKVIRVPVGRSAPWLETPLGAASALLDSRGDRAPYRYALRTPSFAHAPLLAHALVGHSVADAAGIISSFPLVVGDLDK